MAMHTILKSARNITNIFLSLAIWASDNTQGLRKGLPLVNPHRVILVDPGVAKPLKNKNLTALTKVVLKRHNLRVFDFPYFCELHYAVSAQQAWMTRATNLAGALAQSQVETIPSLQVLQFFNPTMFPILREIQISVLDWPTTEREISKSEWVPLAEKWLGHGIKLTDVDGQHWIPRIKRSRGR
ncbi:hypothetical protein DFH06DRAFT_1299566 [Mycena polygramma]|nr:hypothetical protein DFH06DRAFT_1299566 [Mycena polygramma]